MGDVFVTMLAYRKFFPNCAWRAYVVDTLYVDLIERYAQAEGVELKDVVNLAFHEFFERRQYLPEDRP
jgi:hypothetical protein